MNEEQLADLLAQHLDTLLAGDALPAELSAEVADLLGVAQNLSEAAPQPRPEFGAALKESLLGPVVGGNGATPQVNSAFGGSTLSVVVVVSLVGAALLALLVSVIILVVVQWGEGAVPPQPTPAQQTPLPVTPTFTVEPTITTPATSETPPPAIVTPTPIIDALPVITVTIEIIVEPPPLVPGSGGGGSGGGSGGGGNSGGDGDHDRGHGNDSDGNDEDNPGKGGDD